MSGPNAEKMPTSQSVLTEILFRMENLADTANKTVDRVYGKLDGICMPTTTEPEPDAVRVEREYPPTFNEIRGNLNSIEGALQRLNGLMDRCEV
ncbi:MAG: hypothetical protein PF440_10620 [Thiomicrorhabdus sp.]|jgi:hypothetical protein|nr:hypothetical protein [Thiomicrorhabdus sp.]